MRLKSQEIDRRSIKIEETEKFVSARQEWEERRGASLTKMAQGGDRNLERQSLMQIRRPKKP